MVMHLLPARTHLPTGSHAQDVPFKSERVFNELSCHLHADMCIYLNA